MTYICPAAYRKGRRCRTHRTRRMQRLRLTAKRRPARQKIARTAHPTRPPHLAARLHARRAAAPGSSPCRACTSGVCPETTKRPSKRICATAKVLAGPTANSFPHCCMACLRRRSSCRRNCRNFSTAPLPNSRPSRPAFCWRALTNWATTRKRRTASSSTKPSN